MVPFYLTLPKFSESHAFGPGSGRALASLIELNQGAAFTERAAAKADAGFYPTQVPFTREGRVFSCPEVPLQRAATCLSHLRCVFVSVKSGICNSRWLPVSVTVVELMAGATGWP